MASGVPVFGASGRSIVSGFPRIVWMPRAQSVAIVGSSSAPDGGRRTSRAGGVPIVAATVRRPNESWVVRSGAMAVARRDGRSGAENGIAEDSTAGSCTSRDSPSSIRVASRAPGPFSPTEEPSVRAYPSRIRESCSRVEGWSTRSKAAARSGSSAIRSRASSWVESAPPSAIEVSNPVSARRPSGSKALGAATSAHHETRSGCSGLRTRWIAAEFSDASGTPPLRRSTWSG